MADEQSGVHQINVKSPKSNREVNFEKNFGSNLDEAVELFGHDAVYALYIDKAVINTQQAARNVLDSGYKTNAKGEVVGEIQSEDEAITAGVEFTPGVSRRKAGVKKDPVAAIKAGLESGAIDKATLREQLAAILGDGDDAE